jgi:two-component system NtrC family sensor kinase
MAAPRPWFPHPAARRLLRSLSDGALLLDRETGTVLDANRALGRVLGRRASQLIGRPLAGLHAPEAADGLLNLARGAGRGTVAVEIAPRGGVGETVRCEITLLPMADREGRLVAAVYRRSPGDGSGGPGEMSSQAVGRLLSMFLRSGELPEILDDFLRELGTAVGADRCGIAVTLPGDSRQEFIVADRTWSRAGVESLEGVRWPYRGQEIFDALRREPETLVFEDSRTHPRLRPFRELLVRYDVSAAILQPLAIAGTVRGLLWPHRCGRARPFSPGEIDLVREAASQAALGIERHRLEARDRRRGRQIALLGEVQRRALERHSLQDLLDGITESMARTLGIAYVNVALVDPGGATMTVRSVYGGVPILDPRTCRIRIADEPGAGLMGAAAAGRRSVLCNNVRLDPRYLAAHPEAKSELDLPIEGAGELLGVLSLQSDRLDAFDPEEVDLYAAFAGQLAGAIRNARVYDRETRRIGQLQVLHRLQSCLARLGEPEELAGIAAGAFHEAMPEMAVAIGLVDERRGALVVRARAGNGIGEDGSIRLDDPSSLAAEAVRSGALRMDPGDPTRVVLPVLAGQQVVGVLLIAARREEAFDADEVATFQAVAAVLGVALDNARLFERIEREKEEWATTFDAITDMLSIHDQDQRLLRGNRALLARLQAPAYAMTGRTCAELYAEIVGVPFECPHPEAERQGLPASREIELPGRGAFRLTALPRFRAGSAIYSVHVCEDITEERRLREQLLQSEKMSAVGQLVSGVAHELNNPLAGVMGYTQLMLGRPIDSKMRVDLERVFNEARRAARIVQNLLTFARKHKPEKRFLGMNGIIEKTLELRAYELRVSNITVETDFDPDLPRTMLDFHQMQQVVLNVLTNAEQAMLEASGRGRLWITTRGRGNRIEIRIRDDGPGIAPEHLPRILEPFFTTKPVGQGTGLGLSICDGIVKEHGGRLAAESTPGQGATFIIDLPVVAAEEAGAAEGVPAPARAVAGGTVLVVDDEASIQDLLVEVLTRDGFRVDTAGNGATALAKIEKGGYDLIISDLKMPGMSGSELYEAIRVRRPDLAGRVIFTSGDTASASTEEFLRRTGSRALPKPFTIEELRAVLGRFFGAS